MAKCNICGKRWFFSKQPKCDCHKKKSTHDHLPVRKTALLSDPPKYRQDDIDPNLQYYSTKAIQDISEPKKDECWQNRYYQTPSHHSNHSHNSDQSCDSSSWSSGSNDSSSYDSGSSSSSSWD
ncbi:MULTISPECIES: hypothetical protein [unclassified Acinetobacter]|uniref:hypothetical protein n=1 Tax=unclassified Acinetobacter TaxID=196816 RepID=UPI00190A7A7E|nr:MULTISPECIES: hypothetical protein [unclassified Acinetobacter]MBK0062604.1 hypothetical protein [Acinetobacter sp. S55]MBK0065819.1 hypothetical protein [Acinetobacter sp. S54]